MLETTQRYRFFELIEELHRELDLELPERQVDAQQPAVMTVEMHGEIFEVTHGTGSGDDRLVCSCRLGPIEADQMSQVLQSVLRLNHELGPGSGAGFCADENERELLYVSCLPLQGLTGAQLFEHLAQVGAAAANWRDSGVLGEPDTGDDPDAAHYPN